MSVGWWCPEGVPEESAKQDQQAEAGVRNQYTGPLEGWPVTEGMLDGVAAASLFGIPRKQGSL